MFGGANEVLERPAERHGDAFWCLSKWDYSSLGHLWTLVGEPIE